MGDRRAAIDAVTEVDVTISNAASIADTRLGHPGHPQQQRVQIALYGISAGNSRRPDRVDALVHAKRLNPGLEGPAGSSRHPFGKADYRGIGMPRATCSVMAALGAITQRSNSSARLPAQLSNSCTASAPASIWPDR